MRRSLGRCSSFGDSGHGVCLLFVNFKCTYASQHLHVQMLCNSLVQERWLRPYCSARGESHVSTAIQSVRRACCSIPGRGKTPFSLTRRPHRLWGKCFLYSGYMELFPWGQSDLDTKRTVDFYLVRRPRTVEICFHLPIRLHGVVLIRLIVFPPVIETCNIRFGQRLLTSDAK
jgi:hypothetical protein